jgi:hypothetical protein
MEKGNPDFVLTPELEADALEQFNALVDDEIVHSNAPHGTLAPITSEDREIDQMLERAAKSNPVSDLHVETPLIPEKKKRDVLRNHIAGYRPANTMNELQEQVHLAKTNEIDSIEGTPTLVQQLWRKDFEYIKNGPGYGIYHDIRVYIDGFFEQNKDADKETMEQRNHSKGAKIDIGPIITPQKV